jgi:dihydropteroate synthase
VNESSDSISPSARVWRIGPDRTVSLATPRIMGILNVTPDSFADGGAHIDPARAVDAALAMVADGAAFIDVGGESTRPGASAVPPEEQLWRVMPVIGPLARRLPAHAAVSIDTTSAQVARAALDAGASIINDISAGRDDPAMLSLAGERGCGLILMHRERTPEADRFSDRYNATSPAPMHGDAVEAVARFLAARVDAAQQAGVAFDAIVLDPGLGFGKTVEQNLALIAGTLRLLTLGRPVLSGLSRKSFVGRVALRQDSTPDERLAGTLGLSLRHVACGAAILRVHDVLAHVHALRAFQAGDVGAGSPA